MPEHLTTSEFLSEVWDDYKSPTTSNFFEKLSGCRQTVTNLEESLDFDRSGLTRMKKSVKALYSSGNSHVINNSYLAENLERLADSCRRDQQSDIATAFVKFAVVTKELSALMKNLMQNLNNIVMFPLDTFLKGDLRGVKGDLKKPFDRASKDYDTKLAKIEKEKRQLAKDAGMIKTEFTGAEVAEELEKERRLFQLQMCEYLIKVNEIRTKKGVDLLQHLVDYYRAQNNYFSEGLKTLVHFKAYIDELVVQLCRLKSSQDMERRELVDLRDQLRTFMATCRDTSSGQTTTLPSPYSLHQLPGNKAHGYERAGFLLKKSEGKMRKVWQKRRCAVKDGILSISHSDTTKEPVRLNLLTCQVKLVPDDPGKKCFDLVSSSKNRTYHFQADDVQDMEVWISVLNNAKESVLMKAFGEQSNTADAGPYNQSIRELTRTILTEIRRLPGNSICADCSSPDPDWLSVNLGVLICLECCGVHREMGVHISRTQSLVIDDPGSAKLLLARTVGNQAFNEIMEATMDLKNKPQPHSTMEEKKAFIRSKYEKHRYAIVTCQDVEDRRSDLKQAILTRDIYALLQVYAEGIDFSEPLPDVVHEENALHLSVLQEDGTSLYMVDFIIQNTNSQDLGRRTTEGNTVLHLCSIHNRTECMKLVLRMQPDLIHTVNTDGLTAMDICLTLNNDVCIDLLKHAASGLHDLFEHVNIDWNIMLVDDHPFGDVDYSDDELEATPERKCRSRPGSLVLSGDFNLGLVPAPRSHTADNIKPLPPPPPPNFSSMQKPKYSSVSSSAFGSDSASSSGPSSAVSANNLTLAGAVAYRKKTNAPLPPSATNRITHAACSSQDNRLTRVRAGHVRNPSDPGFTAHSHFTVPPPPHPSTGPSDQPPPLPVKTRVGLGRLDGLGGLDERGGGAIPPPPQFRTTSVSDEPSRLPTVSEVSRMNPSTSIKPSTLMRSGLAAEPGGLGSAGVLSGGGRGGVVVMRGGAGSGVSIVGGEGVGVGVVGGGGRGSRSSTIPMRSTSKPIPLPRPTASSVSSSLVGSAPTNGSSDTIIRAEQLVGSQQQQQQQSKTSLTNQLHSGVVVDVRERCVALYKCQADNDDELSFNEGDIIVIITDDVDEEDWLVGEIEGHPERRGIFPATFVQRLQNNI